MSLRITRPVAGDIASLAALYQTCRAETDMAIVPEYFAAIPAYIYTQAWENAFRAPTQFRAALAVENDETIGFYIAGPMEGGYDACLRDVTLPHNCGELHQLYLRANSRGRGIGRTLYDHARRDMAELGHNHFTMCTYRDNEKAIGFYTALGARILKHDILDISFDGKKHWQRPVTFLLADAA